MNQEHNKRREMAEFAEAAKADDSVIESASPAQSLGMAIICLAGQDAAGTVAYTAIALINLLHVLDDAGIYTDPYLHWVTK